MDLAEWIVRAKAEFKGKLPQVHYDEGNDNYWIGYKFTKLGHRIEMPLAREMMESTAAFLLAKVADLF